MSNSILEQTATVTNLLAAYEGESNAHSKYILFAAKADAEGWLGAASLFRAAARAEEIHAKNHARVLKQLCAEPKRQISPSEVKSTLENLKAALAGEEYEIAAMYPGFIMEATNSDIPIATRSLTLREPRLHPHRAMCEGAVARTRVPGRTRRRLPRAGNARFGR